MCLVILYYVFGKKIGFGATSDTAFVEKRVFAVGFKIENIGKVLEFAHSLYGG